LTHAVIDPATASPLALAELHLETLYQTDDAGRIVYRSADVPAPRIHLVRTAVGNRWLLGATLGDAEAQRLGEILSQEPALPACGTAVPRPPQIEHTLSRESALRNLYRGPALVFTRPVSAALAANTEHVMHPSADARFQGPLRWVRDALPTEHPITARFVNDKAVSVCHSPARGAGAAEAGVETNPNQRRRGHARAVVAAWARLIQQEGVLPMYGTTWDNVASRAIAAKLGLRLYAEDWHID
jgi:RimJ/RimL family protein N-acetyltransferase